jgi:hypothetical protein
VIDERASVTSYWRTLRPRRATQRRFPARRGPHVIRQAARGAGSTERSSSSTCSAGASVTRSHGA